MAKVKIIYGTSGGNTEIVCQKIVDVLIENKHSVDLIKAKLASLNDLNDYDLLILASPTYGHGVLEQYMDKFLHEMQNIDFTNTNYCVVALGDMKYDEDYFIESAKILDAFMSKKSGNLFIQPLKIAKSPLPQLNTRVQRWAQDLCIKLNNFTN